MAGYIRQSSFSDGDTITAALFNNEYNQILNAFSNTSGHAHDGTAAEGPVIGLIGDAGETAPNNKVLIDTTNNYIEFYVQVSSSPVQQLYIADGAIVPVTDSDIDLGTTSLRFKDTYTDTITTTGNVSVGGNLTVTGTTTFNGGTITMGDAATDNVVFGADVDSNIIPDDDDTYDLGSSSQQWRNLYIDGTAEIDTLAINGTTVTSTAAELNILDGVTASATDINLIDGITNGTVIASKAIVTDSNKDITGGRNITISGELDAATLDISGDADIDGTLEADAITIAGVTLAETISDTVGAMVSSNTETNITVTYDDSDNTLDFVLPASLEITTAVGIGGGSTNGVQISQGAIAIKNGGTQSYVDFYCESSNAHYTRLQAAAHSAYSGNVTATLPVTTGTLAVTSEIPTTEQIQDIVGAMVSSNTETNITITYQDSDGTLDFVVDAAQPNVTSLGTLTSLTVDDVFINGAQIGHTGDTDLITLSSGVVTVAGELDATSLDISGDADIDGTLEADAITIGGVTLAETISDTVGAMVTSNTESGITVAYQDADNTLDFTIGTLNQDTTGNAATATALATARTIHGVSFDGTANIDLSEVVQDTVGAMFSSNTESGITVTYQDSDGTIDLTVGTLNQDTTGTAATVTTAAQPNITSLGTLTTLTVDDITINGSTISDASDLTIDVGGDLILDAADSDIILKQDGTSYGQLTRSGNDFRIFNLISDGDLVFRGNDGGVNFTALTLDMSAAGAATFNAGVTATTGTYSGLVTMGGIEVDQYVTHAGDTNTYMEFGTDTLDLRAGGIKGLTVNGNGEVVINEDQANIDLRVESDTDANAFRVQASTGIVSVGKVARGILTTDNDGSFDIAASNNFKCTPSGNFTLTFTNIAIQTGNILLINSGGHTVSAHANTKVDANILGTISTAGTYLLAYFSDGTNVYMTNSAAYS